MGLHHVSLLIGRSFCRAWAGSFGAMMGVPSFETKFVGSFIRFVDDLFPVLRGQGFSMLLPKRLASMSHEVRGAVAGIDHIGNFAKFIVGEVGGESPSRLGFQWVRM